MNTAAIVVVTTVGNVDDARQLAGAIVGRRPAACAQVAKTESSYSWKGRLQNEDEYRVLFKTVASVWEAIEEAIVQLHPCELPAVHAFARSHAFRPYQDWILNSVGLPGGPDR